AYDGIRDYKVTGVQTCALPIYEQRVPRPFHVLEQQGRPAGANRPLRQRGDLQHRIDLSRHAPQLATRFQVADEAGQIVPRRGDRSEERRGGKGGRTRWATEKYR